MHQVRCHASATCSLEYPSDHASHRLLCSRQSHACSTQAPMHCILLYQQQWANGIRTPGKRACTAYIDNSRICACHHHSSYLTAHGDARAHFSMRERTSLHNGDVHAPLRLEHESSPRGRAIVSLLKHATAARDERIGATRLPHVYRATRVPDQTHTLGYMVISHCMTIRCTAAAVSTCTYGGGGSVSAAACAADGLLRVCSASAARRQRVGSASAAACGRQQRALQRGEARRRAALRRARTAAAA